MRIGIIGGGPAGTVCALSLLRGAAHRRERHEVLLFDGKSFLRPGPRGCNMCAGVISGSLLDHLAALGAPVPESLIQRHLAGHYFETRAGGAHIPKQPGSTICTVFRSAGPMDATPDAGQSFDQFLLHSAVAAGATQVRANVTEVTMPFGPGTPFSVRTAADDLHEVDVVVGAFGVNSALATHFEALGFGYRRPSTFHVCQADLRLDPTYLHASLGGEVKIFSLGLPRIRFGALTPKREHVTVTIIGSHLRRSDLERFLRHPSVRRHFPAGWQLPKRYCHCHPLLPVTAARNPVTDRLLLIGDANVSRYLKGGIESAFFTAGLAARMILEGRLSRRELIRGYVRPCHARYRYDNLYGQFLFRCNDAISRMRPVAEVGLRLLDREQHLLQWPDRHHTRILWHIFTGDEPYRMIMREAITPATVLSALSLSLGSAVHPATGNGSEG